MISDRRVKNQMASWKEGYGKSGGVMNECVNVCVERVDKSGGRDGIIEGESECMNVCVERLDKVGEEMGLMRGRVNT
jgi:D-aminopeptidase